MKVRGRLLRLLSTNNKSGCDEDNLFSCNATENKFGKITVLEFGPGDRFLCHFSPKSQERQWGNSLFSSYSVELLPPLLSRGRRQSWMKHCDILIRVALKMWPIQTDRHFLCAQHRNKKLPNNRAVTLTGMCSCFFARSAVAVFLYPSGP